MDGELSQQAERHGLRRVGARPAVGNYFRQVWARRDFLLTLARSRIQASTQQDRLGMAWLFITPLLDAVVYGVVFGVLQGSKKPDHFILYLLIGIFFFRYFTDCVSTGARTITSARALVQSLSFPRMVLPLARALEHLLNFVPVLGLLLVLCVLLGVMPQWRWLYLVPALLLWILFNTGVVLFVARLAVHFRDIGQIIPFGNRFLRYFSGVFYAPAAFVAGYPIVMMAFNLNPIYDLLELVRYALIPDYTISLLLVVSGVAWSVGMFVVGSVFFWSAEEAYGRVT